MAQSVRNVGDIARSMAAAPAAAAKPAAAVEPAVEGVASAVLEPPANPVEALFGRASFRINGNAKWYEDDRNPAKRNMNIATANFNLAGINLAAKIYQEEEIVQRPDGRYRKTAIRLSMPKCFANPEDPTTALHLKAFKATIMEDFKTWRATLDPKLAKQQRQSDVYEMPDEKIDEAPAA